MNIKFTIGKENLNIHEQLSKIKFDTQDENVMSAIKNIA